MGARTQEQLSRIRAANELQIQTRRLDGILRNPVIIWVVRHGDDLYVRSVNGRESSWFQGAQVRHEGHIQAGGVDRDVLLVETDGLCDELDAAYRAKYHYSPSAVDHIASHAARAATLKLVPAGNGPDL